MSSLNKVMLIGNLGRNPEVRYATNGNAVTNIAIATSERYKDKQTGEQKEHTEWHRIVFFGKLAEIAGQYLKKGSSCFVEGQLRTRKYTDGNGIDRYTTEIVGASMRMLGSRGENGQSSPENSQSYPSNPEIPDNEAGFDDDIPF